MDKRNSVEVRALEYVRNTNGGATEAIFVDDHEPIGERLWLKFMYQGFVRTDENGRIWLTEKGKQAVNET